MGTMTTVVFAVMLVVIVLTAVVVLLMNDRVCCGDCNSNWSDDQDSNNHVSARSCKYS